MGGRPAEFYSYLDDGKGNVTALLNGSGQVAQSYQYDPFGVPMGATGSVNQPMRFSTKPYDEQTGLSYYGYRFYNPALGRWLTRDPIGEKGGINLYNFVENNPINMIDPWGLFGWDDVGRYLLNQIISKKVTKMLDNDIGERIKRGAEHEVINLTRQSLRKFEQCVDECDNKNPSRNPRGEHCDEYWKCFNDCIDDLGRNIKSTVP